MHINLLNFEFGNFIMEKITIFGAGYVGLVTAICFAQAGHQVVCTDVNTDKIDLLIQGIVPIYEPGLQEMLERNLQAQRISFTTDIKIAVAHAMYQFIAVGTPSLANGAADLTAVFAVANKIAEHMDSYKLVITKSTVPVGTAKEVAAIVQRTLAQHNQTFGFDVVSNPEFLKQGAAIHDFMQPDRIIVGVDNPTVSEKMRQLYLFVDDISERFIVMDIASAELTKYAANAFLATKISFINEISQIAERVGGDIEQIRRGLIKDPRIGEHFLYAGCGYGGSCFPKDVDALIHTAEDNHYHPQLLKAVTAVNQQQKNLLFHKLQQFFAMHTKQNLNESLKDKTIALWGLAFKPKTDDMREAPSRTLMEALWQAGATVQAYDPVAMKEAKRIYPNEKKLQLCESAEQTLQGADVLVIVTEWDEFKKTDLARIKNTLKYPAIFDGRNLFTVQQLAQYGLEYYGIGCGVK